MKTITLDPPRPDFNGHRIDYPVSGAPPSGLSVPYVVMERQDFILEFAISYLQVSIWQGECNGVLYQTWKWFYADKPRHLWTVTNEKPTPAGYN